MVVHVRGADPPRRLIGLLNFEQFDFENERRVGRDSAVPGSAIRERWRHDEAASAANLHSHRSLIPARDNLTNTQREGERLAADRGVKIGPFLSGRDSP